MSLPRFLSVSLLTVTLLLTLSCSKSDTGTGPGEDDPVSITVSPNHGIPTAVLDISGLTIDSDSLTNYSARIGEELAPIGLSEDSVLQIGVPLFLDTASGWTVPPTDSVPVEIWKDGKLVAQSGNLIWIDSLPHADGTVEELQGTLDTLATDIRAFLVSLPTFHDWEAEYRDSIASVIGAITSGPEFSIQAMLEGTSSLVDGVPVDPELIDALIAKTGVLEYWQEYATTFRTAAGNLSRDLSAKQAAGNLCPTFGEDSDLACQMQVYVLLKDFSEEFLSETRREWSNGMGWLVNILSFHPAAAAFPPMAVAKGIGTVLTVTDIVFNTAILSLLPSHITSFEMTLGATEMEVDEYTSSQIYVSAANTPQRMTINQMVDLVFATMSLRTPSPGSDDWIKVLNLVQEIVNLLRDAYSVFFAIDPTTFGDPNLVDGTFYMFPDISWGPVLVENHDLVELVSFDPGVLEPDTAVFEWWSVGCGQASVYARTRGAGDRSTLVVASNFCIGCSYHGGAFGNESAATDNQHVTVGHPGGMDINISGLPEGDSADVWVYFPGGAFEYIGGSRGLTELESGEYRVDANEVEGSDGITYASDPLSRTVEVTCDSTIAVNIEYTPKYGNIYLVVSDLDFDGAPPADIRVEGPNSFVVTINATTLIDSLEPGTYDVLASEVDDGNGQTYVPDPEISEVTVERNSTATLTINHAPKFGYVNLQVENLPPGIDGEIDIVGPNDYFHHSIEPEIIDSLLEGEYTINAYDIVDNNGDTISPVPISQVVTVIPGEEVTATVDYSLNRGKIQFNISGLPYYVDGSIDVTGPGGQNYHLVDDTLLESLAEGDYTFTGHRVTHSSSNRAWDPHPATQTITVIAGETAIGEVLYKSIYGTLVVHVAKPSSVDADIDVEGDSLTQHVTETTTISNVPVGSYSIVAYNVPIDSSITLTAKPPVQSATITAGDTTTVEVAYEAPLVVTWTYGPSRTNLGHSESFTNDSTAHSDTATVEEFLSPPGFQVNDLYQIITTTNASVSSSASTNTTYSDGEASVSISGGGTSGTINLRAVARSTRFDEGMCVSVAEVGFGQSGHFNVDTIASPNTPIATGLNVKVFNPSEKPFYLVIDWDFSASSDIDQDYQADARYYILYTNRQYTNPDSHQSFDITYSVLAESCEEYPPPDTTCWRGERTMSTVRYGQSPAYFELFIAAYAHAQAFSYPQTRNETADLDGIININVMEGDPNAQ